jgi:hypothetical protein
MKSRPIGRPPRTDNPRTMHVRLAGKLCAWLQRQAAREGRYAGDVVASALELYRKRTRRP